MTSAPPSKAITIYVDADACPVKQEIYRVAARHGIKVIVVSNSPIAVPREPMIERVVVGAGMDAADHWIVERVSASTPAEAAAESATDAEEAAAGERRHRDHGRHPARQPLRKGRRGGDRPDRAGLHRGLRSA